MFERRNQPLASLSKFIRRLCLAILFGLLIIAISLYIGMLGYHSLEKMPWIDAFVNAAMILSGMGPVTELEADGGKFYGGWDAGFSGLAFIVMVGVILAPAIHRALHKFHLEETNLDRKKK